MSMLVEAPAAVEDALASVLDHPDPLVQVRPTCEGLVGGILEGGAASGRRRAGARAAPPDRLVQVGASSL